MRKRCTTCRGKGFIEHVTTCTACNGLGTTKLVIGQGDSNDQSAKCEVCGGTGRIVDPETCPEDCEEGYFYVCDLCGKEINKEDGNLCGECKENPVAIRFIKPLNEEALNSGKAVAAIVTRILRDEVHVDLGAGLKGKFKTAKTNLFRQGQIIPVRLGKVSDPKRPWLYYVVPVKQKRFKIELVHAEVPQKSIQEIVENGQEKVAYSFVGQITNVKRLRRGPSFFTFVDESGVSIIGTAFGIGGRIPFPKYEQFSVVEVIGELDEYKGRERFLIHTLKPVDFEERQKIYGKIANVVLRGDKTVADFDLSISEKQLNSYKEEIVNAALKIREAAISGRNIILRYNTNSVDSTVGAYAMDFALRGFLRSRGVRPSDFRHVLRRLPVRGNVVDSGDIIRDISFVLDGPVPGEIMPLVVLFNTGTTEDSLSSYYVAQNYDLPIVTISHQGIAEAVQKLTNPVGSSNVISSTNISSGMLSFEVARLVLAEYDFNFHHLPVISALYTRAKGDAFKSYLEKVESNDELKFDESKLSTIADVLDYILFSLRYSDGGEVIRDLLFIGRRKEKSLELTSRLEELVNTQRDSVLQLAEQNLEKESVNDVEFNIIDLELNVPRFEYPPHGLLLTLINDKSNSDKTVTLGIGSDYCIIRTKGLSQSFSELLLAIQSDLPTANIQGGGYDQVGSFKFISSSKASIVNFVKNYFSA